MGVKVDVEEEVVQMRVEVEVQVPYVEIPTFGGGGSGEAGGRRIWRVRRRRSVSTTTNKGFARRPQEFLAWEMGGRM